MSKKSPILPRHHGTVTGYAYGCRCDACRNAQRLRVKRQYHARKARKATES